MLSWWTKTLVLIEMYYQKQRRVANQVARKQKQAYLEVAKNSNIKETKVEIDMSLKHNSKCSILSYHKHCQSIYGNSIIV